MPEGVARIWKVFEISERRVCSIVKAGRELVRTQSYCAPESAFCDGRREVAT